MNKTIIKQIACGALATLLMLSGSCAHAAFHLWQINEIYSNHSGTVQFVELATTDAGQEFLAGHTITSTQGATTRTFTLGNNLATGTTNKKFLIATPAFADLGIVTPDYIMPEGFLFTANGSVNFSDVHTVSYLAIPTDGIQSISASGVAGTSSPTNYAGVSGSISSAPPTVLNSFLGANLNGIADFRRNHEYVDLMRQSRRFGSAADPFNTVIPVGTDGWPTGDFGVTLMAAQTGVTGIAGTYKGFFTGQATVTSAASGSVSNLVYTSATNTSAFDISFPAPTETMALRFQSVSANNPVKNLRVIRPGFATTNSPIFTPAYLNHISRFQVLRFMDWLSTNEHANSIVGWADRPTLEKKRTEAEGARWEAIVELANTVNRDIWINIPVRANDEYVTNLATQLRDTLNPGVNVYVEYSNELWNAAFPQFAIQKQLAIDEVAANANSPLAYDGSTDQNVWAFRRVAKRLKEVSDIFKTVWGASAINTRVRPVLAGQMANSFIVTEGLDLVDVGLNVRPGTVFYALSGAPYIFPSATNQASEDETPGLTAAQILTAIESGVTNAPNGDSYQYESHLALAAWHGLKVLAYEGGFDTFGGQNIAAKRQANLDSQIRTHCRTLLNRWHAFGFETFLYFNAGADSYDTQFGQWPLLEDLQDTVYPKNQCMDDVLGAAVPAMTAGISIASAVPGGAFIGSTAPTGTITNVSGPFGFPGFAQYLLRVDTAGTYELRFTSTGSDTPKVGVHLNGLTLNSGFLLPQSANFTDSSPITVTLRKGINALRLSRPADASTWTIQSLSLALTLATPSVAVTGNGSSIVGSSVTFVATVSGSSPTGTVSFKAGATTITGCSAVAIASSAASCTTNALSVGSASITAIYSGDGNNDAATSPAVTHIVSQVTVPVCTLAASPTSIAPGSSSTLTASCSPAAITFAWTNSGFATTAASGSVSPTATTTYSVIGSNAGGAGNSASATVTVTVPASNSARLINLSTRVQVQTGDNVMIGGFIIQGSSPKKVLIRAVGPNLANFGVSGVLADPVLQLFSGQTVIASNDDWQTQTTSSDVAAITASTLAPADPKESAILTTLNPGAYTAIVSGKSNTSGVGIVEVYELDHPEIPLINISTRAKVQTGDNVMIGGFIIQGDAPQTVLIRAVGPNLANFGVTGVLSNPTLQLFSGQTVIASNDDWQTSNNANYVPDVAAIEASTLAPVSPLESAILITLQPGAYTAIVSGSGGGTGVGIIEVFAQ